MTNEEAAKIIESEHVWLPRTYGWRKVEDAHKMAIKALRNQAKYETALEMAVRDSDKSGTDIWCHDCPYEDDVKLEHCWECGVKYYKRKAGID